MVRREDWSERLTEAVDAAYNRPFAWGMHDCALWAADVVEAMTGRDPAESYRGRYTTPRSAIKALRDHGFADLGEAITDALGEPIEPKLAQRGDVVLTDNGGQPAAGVCIGKTVAVPGRAGLVFQPIAGWLMAWRV